MMVLRSQVSFLAMFVLAIFSLLGLVESAPVIKRSLWAEFVSPLSNTAVTAAGTVTVKIQALDDLPLETQVKVEVAYPMPGPRASLVLTTLGTWTAEELSTTGREVQLTQQGQLQNIIVSCQYKGSVTDVWSQSFRY